MRSPTLSKIPCTIPLAFPFCGEAVSQSYFYIVSHPAKDGDRNNLFILEISLQGGFPETHRKLVILAKSENESIL